MIIQESANERTKLLPSVHEVTNRPASRAASVRDGDELHRPQTDEEEALPPPPYSRKAENGGDGATRRFLRAFCIATVLTLILGSVATLSLVALRQKREPQPHLPGPDRGDRHHDWDEPWRGDHGRPDLPHPPPNRGPGPDFPGPKWPDGVEGEEVSCRYLQASWKSFSYDLPLESVLFFISEGLATTGQFDVVMKDPGDDQSSARLTVHASQPRLDPVAKHFEEDDDDEGVKICYRRRSRYFTGWGVKIESEADKPRALKLTLELPLNSTGLASLQLETQLPYFTHSITGLDSSRPLRTLKLLSKMADITVDDARAAIIDVRTSGAEIGGGFTGRYVNLETTSWPITVEVNLLPPPSDERTSKLVISNHDALISTSITLGQSDDPDTDSIPRYQVSLVDVGDQNLGRMDVQIRSQRPTSLDTTPPSLRPYTLDFAATSKASPIKVGVDPWFEGQFILRADAEAVVEGETEHVHDPAGMGRRRNVQFTRSDSSSVEGSVAWEGGSGLESDADVGVGRLLVRASGATARLLL